MSSLVTDVLSSAGKLKRQELGSLVNKLIQRIDDIKLQIQEPLEKCYHEFHVACVNTVELARKVDAYKLEVKDLNNLIENDLKEKLRSSGSEFHDVCAHLREATLALQTVEKLAHVHEAMENSQNAFGNQNYVDAVKYLTKTEDLLVELSATWKENLTAIKNLRTKYLVLREKLMYDLGEVWSTTLQWSIPESEKTGGQCELLIPKPSTEVSAQLPSLIQALHLLHYLESRLKIFGTRLLKNILTPVVTQVVRVKIDHGSPGFRLRVSVDPVQSSRPLPLQVLADLTVVFEFLYDNLFKFSVEENGGEDSFLMNKLGALIYKDFFDLLVKECLSPAVPSHKTDLERYNAVIDATQSFHNHLVAKHFLTEDNQSLLDYAKDVDVLFVNKMCQDLLGKARQLMTVGLHDCIQLHDEEPERDLPPLNCPVKSEKDVLKVVPLKSRLFQDPKISKNTFRFPVCQVSKSATMLLELLRSILKDATASSTFCAVRLFYTARNILELYCDVVPTYHRVNLEQLPHQSALFHNNCMYLAHHAMTLGHSFRIGLPQHLRESWGSVTFADFVPRLRDLGTEIFLSQMQRQRNQLREILSELGSFQNLVNNASQVHTIERALKKCILQLQHLQKVWTKVLPDNVYRKTIGTLLNSVVEEVIGQVTTLEDIPSDSAIQMIGAFKLVTDKASALFKVCDGADCVLDLQKYVPEWMKLKELIFTLGGSLQDIADRWSEGKGPLATAFTVPEVKQLIRALFQNTDRRAALLSKIK